MKIKIRGINKVKNRHGTVYYYDRITGKRIQAKPGTAAFVAEVEAIRAGLTVKAKGEVKTWNDLVGRYKASPAFDRLGSRTKKDYNGVLDRLQKLGLSPFAEFTQQDIVSIRDRIYQKRKRRAANYTIAVLSRIFNWAIETGLATTNPAASVKKIEPPKDAPVANRKWSSLEFETIMLAAKPNIQIAIALAAYAGFREGDVLSLPLTAIRGNKIIWRQRKNGENIELPIHEALRPYLAMARTINRKEGVNTIVVGERGLSMTEGGFRAIFFKIVRELKAKGWIEPGITFHGLRHTVGSYLAEAGAGDSVIQAMLGHKTPHQARKYREQAEKNKGTSIAIQLLEQNKK